MSVVIKVENLSKVYRLGTIGSGTLTEDFSRFWGSLTGVDKTSKIGSDSSNEKEHWALRDINFEIKQGETVGIVGKNGAGKSTLLKILSRVTFPTTGSVKIKGRISSLLEVGTGFHGELSGRENIFLNGAILGMSKKEIKRKFDEIVAFSGVDKYIDTPVKRYSSGMYVRLAFAVAAHLEPEILIVDEVLAVGDAEFQKKCLGKMKDVAGEGRTVLFVSHNMAAVRNLCDTGILLAGGILQKKGAINGIIDTYLQSDETVNAEGMVEWTNENAPGGEEISLNSIKLLNQNSEVASIFYTSAPIVLEVSYTVKKQVSGSRLAMQLLDTSGNVVFSSTNHMSDSETKTPGTYITRAVIPSNLLNKGRYNVFVHFGIPGIKVLVQGRVFLSFDTILMGNNGSFFEENWQGVVAPMLEWQTIKIN
jgi:lipopolysaccharide transport system ATP-binding protein